MIYLLVYGMVALVSIPAHPRHSIHSIDTKPRRETRRIYDMHMQSSSYQFSFPQRYSIVLETLYS